MSTDNVIPLGNITRIDGDPDRVLDLAKGRCPDGVVVMGFDREGDFFFKSSLADGGDVIWLMEMAKKRLLEVGE